MFSKEYNRRLGAVREHHRSSKTYSGKLMRTHATFIKEVIDRHGCRSALDYGCGKGKQWEWRIPEERQFAPGGVTLEEWFGFTVTKYDPGYEPFAVEPVGTFDLVICTYVLGSIPDRDLPAVVDRLHGHAAKAIYVAEQIGTPRKRVLDVKPRTREDWVDILRRPSGVEVTLATRQRTGDGTHSIIEVI